MQKQGYYVTNNSKTDYNVANIAQFTKEAWNESSNKAGWWNRKHGQPFFAVFNFDDSHQSRTMTNSYDWYVENVWEQLPANERISDDAFELPPFYNNTPEMRKQFARVYNSIKLTDKRIGELLAKLDKDQLRDSTIIFFYADHGEGIPRGKTNGINLGYRVPFVIWFPEMYKYLSPWGTSGVVTDELIDFEDLAPTLICISGGELPDHLKGRVLLGNKRSKPAKHLILSTDRADNGTDLVRSITDGKFMYSRNYMAYMSEVRFIRYVQIAEITQQMHSDLNSNKLNPLQKSVFNPRPAEFLYDIEADLWETKNLADNPIYKNVLGKMCKQLDAEIIKSRDVHFLPEYELGRISETGTAYEFRLDNKKYPIKEIYAAASLSGKRGKEITSQQIKLLKSSNEIVRYWATIGLFCQNADLLEPYKSEIIRSMNDTYTPASVTSAALLFRNFKHPEAEMKLKEYCKSKNMDIALMAVNYLIYIDNKQPFVETIKSVHSIPGRNYNLKAACMDFLGILGMVENNSSKEQ